MKKERRYALSLKTVHPIQAYEHSNSHSCQRSSVGDIYHLKKFGPKSTSNADDYLLNSHMGNQCFNNLLDHISSQKNSFLIPSCHQRVSSTYSPAID